LNTSIYKMRVPLMVSLLVATIVHGPLLLFKLPLGSYDTNFNIFFASHYAHHWFDPWNPKWYAGFSQTTYPPLPQQWVGLFSHIISIDYAYMLVQFVAVLLTVVGIYRFSRIWVDDRAASYAALASVFLGSLAMLVYQAGQLSTTFAAPLYLNALPYFYAWTRRGRFAALLKGLALCAAAAAAHHATLLFGAILFALPVLAVAIIDARTEQTGETTGGAVTRAVIFAVVCAAIIAVVLAPFWIALLHYPVTQKPIPHASRSNYILNPLWGLNYWVLPYGAMILALPAMVFAGARERRLVPLLFGFWIAFLLGLGGTTPFGRIVLGRGYEVITMERFSFWATLLAMPLLGVVMCRLIDRFRAKGVIALASLGAITLGFALAWLVLYPNNADIVNVKEVANFLNRDGHDSYRYITLGFGNQLSRLSLETDATTLDGEWNSGRLVPELMKHGAGAITSSKFFGSDGIDALTDVLKHADRYGLKWVFVRDPYYEPLLVFSGWRRVDSLNQGTIAVWEKDEVPPATPIVFGTKPPEWQGLLWGTLPFGSSLVALFLVVFLRERKNRAEVVTFPVEVTPVAEGVR